MDANLACVSTATEKGSIVPSLSTLLLISAPFLLTASLLTYGIKQGIKLTEKNQPNHFPISTGHRTNRCFLWPRWTDEVDKVHTGTTDKAEEPLWHSELHWMFPVRKGRKYHTAFPLFPGYRTQLAEANSNQKIAASVLKSSSCFVFLLS